MVLVLNNECVDTRKSIMFKIIRRGEGRMQREKCILDNKRLVDAILNLKKELQGDFAKYLLEGCDACAKGNDQPVVNELHASLASIYVEIDKIEKFLSKGSCD